EPAGRGGGGAALARGWPARAAAAVGARRGLGLAGGAAAIWRGRLEAVEPVVASAERAFAAAGSEPHEPSVGRALSVLANVPAGSASVRAWVASLRGDPARAVDCARQALAHLGEEDGWVRFAATLHLAVADWERGRLGQAEHALAGLVAERRAAGEGYLAMRVCYELGQVQRAQGCLGAALHTYQQELRAAGGASQQPPFAGMAHVGV